MSTGQEPRQPTEEELRAAYEAELKRIRVEDVVVQTLVSLLNLAGRKAGLAPGSEDERDLGQLQMAIDAARALMPVAEPALGPDAAPLREALSQLQMAFAQLSGGAADAPAGEAPPAPDESGGAQTDQPEGPGPAQRSGRLWVPGQ